MKNRKFYSPLPKIIVMTMLLGIVGCLLLGVCYRFQKQPWQSSMAITCGVIAYHMLIRFLSPVILQFIFHRQYDCRAWWFRQRKWEPALYRILKVKKWKGKAMTYDPREFSLEMHSMEEIVNNMCHAEAVHKLIALLSFTSLFFVIPFGAFPVFLITAILAAAFDLTFVIIQRYNRPRVMRLI